MDCVRYRITDFLTRDQTCGCEIKDMSTSFLNLVICGCHFNALDIIGFKETNIHE